MTDLRKRIKSFKYLEQLNKCCSGSSEPTYDNCMTKGDTEKELVNAYLDPSSYLGAKPRYSRHKTLPEQFIKAVFYDLRQFKMLDPNLNNKEDTYYSKPLDNVLKAIVWTNNSVSEAEVTATQVADAVDLGPLAFGGALQQIITLSKKEESGFVPYKVYQLAGSYTDEYLQEMNSKIKKYDNLFGGFKKVTKEIIGSVEDLDTLLRTDLENQVVSSINKRYYKTYLTNQTGGSGSKQVRELWEAYVNASPEDRMVFESFANFMYRKVGSGTVKGSTLTAGTPFTLITAGTMPADLKDCEVRVNLKRVAARGQRVLIAMLPPALRETAENYFNSKQLDIAIGLKTLLGDAGVSSPTDEVPKEAESLDKVYSCDLRILDKIKNNDVDVNDGFVHDFSTQYDRQNAMHLNKWKLRDDGAFQKKKDDGSFETFDPSDPKYREYFKSAEKCFNSYLSINNDDCCNVIEKLIEGNGEEFMKKIVEGDIKIGDLDKNFSKQNPYTIRQILKSFKFPEIAVWDPFVKGKLKKFPNFNYWVKNVLPNENLTAEEKKKLEGNTQLRDILNMCVSFVNHNVQILNPNIQPFEGTNIENPLLKERGVMRFQVDPGNKPRITWDSSTKDILRAVTLQQTPHSILSTPLIFSGLQFGLRGGGNSNDTGSRIVLNETEVVPQFTTNIVDDITHLLADLKTANKTLRSSEMKKINEELNEFQRLEVELYKKILTINKYVKIAYLMNDNNNEYVSLEKIRQHIANYTEYFKEYSAKDLELKNIGSFLRQYSQDKL
jgi:hypothetical protein